MHLVKKSQPFGQDVGENYRAPIVLADSYPNLL
jgi:hypothetical protein